MDWLTFISNIWNATGSFAWPAAFVIGLLLFRKPLEKVILSLTARSAAIPKANGFCEPSVTIGSDVALVSMRPKSSRMMTPPPYTSTCTSAMNSVSSSR